MAAGSPPRGLDRGVRAHREGPARSPRSRRDRLTHCTALPTVPRRLGDAGRTGWGDDPNYFRRSGATSILQGRRRVPRRHHRRAVPARLPIRFDQVLRRGSWYFEARVIEGYPAIVSYVLEHKLDGFSRWYSTLVVLHDPETGLEFWVAGHHATLRGNQVEGTIAIALSLMERNRSVACVHSPVFRPVVSARSRSSRYTSVVPCRRQPRVLLMPTRSSSTSLTGVQSTEVVDVRDPLDRGGDADRHRPCVRPQQRMGPEERPADPGHGGRSSLRIHSGVLDSWGVDRCQNRRVLRFG